MGGAPVFAQQARTLYGVRVCGTVPIEAHTRLRSPHSCGDTAAVLGGDRLDR